jgi:hypothetical protein
VIGREVNIASNHSDRLYPVVLSTSNMNTSFSPPASALTAAASTHVHQYNMSQVLFNIYAAEQFVLGHQNLPTTWLLLDSCSMIDIVSKVDLLHDVHHVSCPAMVR